MMLSVQLSSLCLTAIFVTPSFSSGCRFKLLSLPNWYICSIPVRSLQIRRF